LDHLEKAKFFFFNPLRPGTAFCCITPSGLEQHYAAFIEKEKYFANDCSQNSNVSKCIIVYIFGKLIQRRIEK